MNRLMDWHWEVIETLGYGANLEKVGCCRCAFEGCVLSLASSSLNASLFFLSALF